MSVIRKLITQIESLNVEQLCEALEYNGYGDCVDRIRCKSIDGQAFLKLTEVQVSLWRLTPPQMRRLWSFIEHVRQNPANFVFVPKKTVKLCPPPISNFSNLQNNFQTHSLGRPQMKPKPQYLEKNKIESVASASEKCIVSSLSKEDNKSMKSRLEHLFKGDLNQNNTFLHNKKPSFLPKPPIINKFVEENNNHDNDDDDDINYGYLPPISIEPPKNLRTPPVENKDTFLNKTRKTYENHNVETELRPPAVPNYKTLPKRPLPSIPREIAPNVEPVKFQNKPERQNLVPQRPAPKTASIFKRPTLPNANERQKIEESEEELEEYASVLEDEPAPSKRPLPAIPIEPIEDLADYGTISEEEDLPPISVKHQFKPIDQHQDFLSQLRLATSPKHKPNIVEEEEEDLVYEPVPDVIEKKEKLLNPTFNLKSRPLPPPPISSNRPNQWPKEERSLPPIPILFNRPNQKMKEKAASDSEEECVLTELKKMTKSDSLNSLTKSPSRTIEKSRSPVNLPKPPPLLPNPPQFNQLNLASNNILTMPKDDFDKETYYREIDRKGARMILKNLEVGTFLVRPSRDEDYICTISIAHSKKTFNVGVQRDRTSGIITLGSFMDVEQPDFKRLQDLINYYCVHPLCLAGQLIVLKNILPFGLR